MNRSGLVIALGLPGAVVAGMLGFLVASFAGDASVSTFSMICWLFWGTVGGACWGAILGIAVGVLRRVRWVLPFLGGAIGAIPGFFEASEAHITADILGLFGANFPGGRINVGGYTSAAFVVSGLFAGLWRCCALIKQDRRE